MTSDLLRSFRADARSVVRELGFLRDRWAPVDLPHAQVHLLLEVCEAGSIRPSDLADRLLTDPAAVSRAIRALTDRGWITSTDDPTDRRQKHLMLTTAGRDAVDRVHEAADRQVSGALALLSADERAAVIGGFRAYARALRRARRQEEFELRPIRPEDDPQVMAIIR